jgi:hypothetical protein
MYRSTKEKPPTNSFTCTECGSTRGLFKGGSLICTNCDTVIYSAKTRKNKFNAVRTVAKDGIKRDSKFEASVADELYLRKLAGDIKDYESQYKVEMHICNSKGEPVKKVSHKIDFRIHHNDNSYELYEVKGVSTSDWVMRRDLLELIWLPDHPDHTYTVRFQNKIQKRK